MCVANTSIFSIFEQKTTLIKQKKFKKHKERNLTQEDFAAKLSIETSNYNRHENGVTTKSKKEWDAMAKILNTTLDDIYEPEDSVYVINGDYAHGNFGSNGTFNSNSEFVFETMKNTSKNWRRKLLG